MTRINAGIDPARLKDRQLLAEHREIKRIPNNIKNGKAIIKDIPPTFRLGTGHVKFFYDKLSFLRKRYVDLYIECIHRGFKVTNYMQAFLDLPLELMNDYNPTDECIEIITQRLTEKDALLWIIKIAVDLWLVR